MPEKKPSSKKSESGSHLDRAHIVVIGLVVLSGLVLGAAVWQNQQRAGKQTDKPKNPANTDPKGQIKILDELPDDLTPEQRELLTPKPARNG